MALTPASSRPTSLPPSGAAGGDLGGTYPNPTVATTGAVKSVAKAGSTALTGAVTLTGGANVTLTQAAQDISIAASGGSEPFNGGTITESLVIDKSAGANATVMTLKLPASVSGFTETLRVTDSADNVLFFLSGAGTNPTLSLLNATGLASADLGLKGLAIVPLATATDPVVWIYDAAGAPAFRVDPDGIVRSAQPVVIEANAAPADGELTAGDVALWFDQTNGAAKLMLKGKTANGTVVTGNVPLS